VYAVNKIAHNNKLYGRPPQYASAPCDFDLWPLTLKVFST